MSEYILTDKMRAWALANNYGIIAKPGESMEQFRQRVFST